MDNFSWNFDFSALPKYDTREKFSYVYDRFYEIAESDALCGIYSIVEASMCNFVGFLVLLKDKAEPRTVLNISDGICFTDNFSRSKDGRYIFLQASIYDGNTERLYRPIVIIDLFNEVFSFIPTDNINPSFEVVEEKEGIFRVIADEAQKKCDKRLLRLTRKKVKIDRLRWNKLDEFAYYVK